MNGLWPLLVAQLTAGTIMNAWMPSVWGTCVQQPAHPLLYAGKPTAGGPGAALAGAATAADPASTAAAAAAV
jgi:hypothetical protein